MAFRKVAQFREFSLEYVSSTAAGKAKFYTDLPGNHLVDRSPTPGAYPLPPTNADGTPATITFTLVNATGAPMEGTLYMLRVEPPATSTLQLRSGVVWIRTISVYLDGNSGEFFETQPVSIGV